MLLDRLPERAALNELLDAARAGRSGVLVMRGEPGIGKTALLEYAIESAAGLRVARVAGVESEMELAFAARSLAGGGGGCWRRARAACSVNLAGGVIRGGGST